MNRCTMPFKLLATLALMLTGCASGTFQPKMTETELAATASKTPHPDNATAELSPHVFAVVAGNGTITLYNAGDESYADFTVWVNKTYSLPVDKLDARSQISISPNTMYNTIGSNMSGATASTITKIQIYNKDKLWDVQGPILPPH